MSARRQAQERERFGLSDSLDKGHSVSDPRNGVLQPDGPDALGYSVTALLLPGFDLTDLSAVAEVFRMANTAIGSERFRLRLFGLAQGGVRSSAGICVSVDTLPGEGDQPARDWRVTNLLLLADHETSPKDWPLLMKRLRFHSRHGTRIGAIGAAVGLLAESGLSGHSKLAAHWRFYHAWREKFGADRVSDHMYDINGRHFSCCGMNATLDLALRAVNDAAGHEITRRIADRLNLERMRNNSDTQVASAISLQRVQNGSLREAMRLFMSHADNVTPGGGIGPQMRIGRRQLQRLFSMHLGMKPNQFAMLCRLRKARQLLLHTTMSVTEVAVATGFVSVSHFAQRYRKTFGRAPSAERQD